MWHTAARAILEKIRRRDSIFAACYRACIQDQEWAVSCVTTDYDDALRSGLVLVISGPGLYFADS